MPINCVALLASVRFVVFRRGTRKVPSIPRSRFRLFYPADNLGRLPAQVALAQPLQSFALFFLKLQFELLKV